MMSFFLYPLRIAVAEDQKDHDCLNDVYDLKRDIGISGHDIRADPQVR